MSSKAVRCIVELYLFELLLGFGIFCSRACHTSPTNIEVLGIMKVVNLIKVLEVSMMKYGVYEKILTYS